MTAARVRSHWATTAAMHRQRRLLRHGVLYGIAGTTPRLLAYRARWPGTPTPGAKYKCGMLYRAWLTALPRLPRRCRRELLARAQRWYPISLGRGHCMA